MDMTHVDRLFREAPDRLSPTRQNPVTGASWVPGLDRIGPQKEAALRALIARDVFASKNPAFVTKPITPLWPKRSLAHRIARM